MKKIALITGARGGIGTAITTALLEQGYRIIATHSSTSAAAAREWFDTQGHQPDRVRLLALDVADTAMCRETWATCCRRRDGSTCWSTTPASPGTAPSSG